MAPSSRHLYPEWLRPRTARDARAGRRARPTAQDDGAWRVWEWLRAFDRRYATLVDLVLAAALFVLCSGWVVERPSTRPNLWFVAALIFPLVFRRRAPMTVFLVIAAVAFVQWLVTGPALADAALLVALYTVALESDWLLVAAAAVILEAGVVMATVRWDAHGQRRQVLRLPHRAGLHRAAGRGGGAGAAQPARLAGRARRAPGARARPAGVAGRGDRAGPHRAGDARRGLAQHPGDGDAGRRRLPAQASDPARAAEAIQEVSSTGRQALTDMRRMLGVLREEPAAGLRRRDGRMSPPTGTAAPRSRPNRGCGSSTRSSSGCAAPASTSRVAARRRALRGLGRGRADGLPDRAGGPDQRAEARRASPTRWRCGWPSTTPTCRVWVTDDGRARWRPRRAAQRERHRNARNGHGNAAGSAATDWPAWPNGPARSGARSGRARGPPAAGRSRPRCATARRPPPHDHPGGAGRRSGAAAQGLPHDPRGRGGHGDRRRGARRRRRRAPRGALPARRRADGRAHARPRRHRGDAGHHRLARGRRDPRADPHHLRPRRVRLQRAAGGRQRLPAQGRPAGRARLGHPHRGPGRRRGVAPHHPAAARGVRPHAARPRRAAATIRAATAPADEHRRWPA